jgi:hypothetical protein
MVPKINSTLIEGGHMSFWQRLQGNAAGIRAAMRDSYQKHLKKARLGQIGVGTDPPHATAMFGALGTRNKVLGLPFGEPYLWTELFPFLELDDQEGLEALADYAVWRELPSDLTERQLQNLASTINAGLTRMLKKNNPAVKLAVRPDFAIQWSKLISEQTKSSIRETNST